MRSLLTAILLLTLVPVFVGCNNIAKKKKKLDARVTLRKKDKIPYGTYVAYNNLKHIFPSAAVDVNSVSPASYRSFVTSYSSYGSDDTTTTLYVIISPYFSPDKREFEALMRFISRGNHVFISSQYWGDEFLDSMDIDIGYNFILDTAINHKDSLWVSVFDPVSHDSLSFTYPGSKDYSYLDDYDSVYSAVLGYNDSGQPNFIKLAYQNGGSIYIHTNPLALTNFFLLHKNNNRYYDNVFSYMPRNVTQIEWDEYFRYGRRFSAWQVIMNHPSLRAAFWVTLLIFLLIFLFDSKRKQRIIPKIQPLRNASLDFVKTIGRLYYQYRDNKNLGIKMTAHLMDHIRQRYNISTATMDEKFVDNLAYKSGYDHAALKKIFYHAKWIQDSPRVSDEELLEFQKLTEAFYKHQ